MCWVVLGVDRGGGEEAGRGGRGLWRSPAKRPCPFGSSGGGEWWLDSGFILKAETAGFPDGLDGECERETSGHLRGFCWPEEGFGWGRSGQGRKTRSSGFGHSEFETCNLSPYGAR